MRVYFAILKQNDELVLILTGGNKNGQDKDIKRACKILRAYTS